MQNICLLGASGAIGKSTLELIKIFPNEFYLYSFSVNENLEAAKYIIENFKPSYLCVTSNKVDTSILGSKYKDTVIYYGEGLTDLVQDSQVDIVVNAIVGSVGVYPTIASIKSSKKIAIANKETLVSFGPIIRDLLNKYKDSILLPVDSEHNAIFQLLEFNKKKVKTITLTASGGALRDFPLSSLENVKIEEVLKHPTWNMGAKITVDCATMTNKCLEVIEANVLFNIDYSNINMIIHPESIIHGIVEYYDGSQMLYGSYPDMKIPISHCLFYPHFSKKEIKSFPPKLWSSFNFWSPDLKRYPILNILPQVGKTGGSAACIFNAANEAAVDLFLQKKIKFTKIVSCIEECLNQISVSFTNKLEDFILSDKQARDFVYRNFKEL